MVSGVSGLSLDCIWQRGGDLRGGCEGMGRGGGVQLGLPAQDEAEDAGH